MTCEYLKKANASTIAQLFIDALKLLWLGEVDYERVPVRVTDDVEYVHEKSRSQSRSSVSKGDSRQMPRSRTARSIKQRRSLADCRRLLYYKSATALRGEGTAKNGGTERRLIRTRLARACR